MYLDIKTLQLAAIVVCCVLGPVSLAFAPTQRYMQPSRFWGGGLVALALGLALVSLHGHVSDFVSLALGPGLLALALSFAQASARSVAGKEGRDLTGLALLAGVVVLLLAAEMLSALAWLRVPLSMGALGVLAWTVNVVGVAVGNAAVAVPARVTKRPVMQPTQPGGSTGTLSVALFDPTLAGLKAIAMVHELPPCTGPLARQVPPATENSLAFAPVMVIEPSCAVVPTGPVTAATNTFCVALVV